MRKPHFEEVWLGFTWLVVLAFLLVLRGCTPEADAGTLRLTVTLPSTNATPGEPCVVYDSTEVDPITLAPIVGDSLTDLKELRVYGLRCWETTDRLLGTVPAAGKEGQELPFDLDVSDGAHAVYGEIWTTAADHSGNESCPSNRYVFAVPPDTTSTPPGPTGPGVRGLYYRGMNHEWFLAERVDSLIDFAWAGAPIAGAPVDSFSIRWVGELLIPRAGHTTIYLHMNNGGRFWSGDSLKIDSWLPNTGRELYAICYFQAPGSYPVRVEMFDVTAAGEARLSWKVPSYTGTKTVVPASAWRH